MQIEKRHRFSPFAYIIVAAIVGVSQKTINNVLRARLDDAKLSMFDSIATALGVPLWVLFIPTLQASDLQSPNRERRLRLTLPPLLEGVFLSTSRALALACIVGGAFITGAVIAQADSGIRPLVTH